MQTLRALLRHNLWANLRVFELLEGLEEDSLSAAHSGSIGSVAETLRHYVTVEDAYLAMLNDDPPSVVFGGSEDEHMARPVEWFMTRAVEIAVGFTAILGMNNEDWLSGPVNVPWLERPITRHDALLQVFTHSQQHRAQILSALGSAGLDVPDIDYVSMLEEDDAAPPA